MLEDRSVHDKQQWDAAIKFMETAVGEKLQQSECTCDWSVNVMQSVYVISLLVIIVMKRSGQL